MLRSFSVRLHHLQLEWPDAQIEVVDPGKEAVGFELDVCLQQKGVGVVCSNDRRS